MSLNCNMLTFNPIQKSNFIPVPIRKSFSKSTQKKLTIISLQKQKYKNYSNTKSNTINKIKINSNININKTQQTKKNTIQQQKSKIKMLSSIKNYKNKIHGEKQQIDRKIDKQIYNKIDSKIVLKNKQIDCKINTKNQINLFKKNQQLKNMHKPTQPISSTLTASINTAPSTHPSTYPSITTLNSLILNEHNNSNNFIFPSFAPSFSNSTVKQIQRDNFNIKQQINYFQNIIIDNLNNNAYKKMNNITTDITTVKFDYQQAHHNKYNLKDSISTVEIQHTPYKQRLTQCSIMQSTTTVVANTSKQDNNFIHNPQILSTLPLQKLTLSKARHVQTQEALSHPPEQIHYSFIDSDHDQQYHLQLFGTFGHNTPVNNIKNNNKNEQLKYSFIKSKSNTNIKVVTKLQ